MNLILIIAVVLVCILLVLAYREGKKHGTSAGAELVGICTAVIDRTVRQRRNLDAILGLFKHASELTNTEIRAALGVSSRTAVRYLDELERLGKITQVGKTGKSVTYRLK